VEQSGRRLEQRGTLWTVGLGGTLNIPLQTPAFLTLYFPYCFLDILSCNREARAFLLFQRAFPVCLQHEMDYRQAGSPPVVHFVLQTGRRSVQKN
jgi:hypothetical protein